MQSKISFEDIKTVQRLFTHSESVESVVGHKTTILKSTIKIAEQFKNEHTNLLMQKISSQIKNKHNTKKQRNSKFFRIQNLRQNYNNMWKFRLSPD